MSNLKKLILIGAIRKGMEPNCGETMKNQLFVKRFKKVFDKVVQVDTHSWRRRPWCLFVMIWELMTNKNATVVISSCDISAYHLIKFLYFIRLKKRVFYWVVGGGFHELVNKRVINPQYYHYLKGIFVQSQDMVVALNNNGLNNVRYIPNSKPVYHFPINNRNGDRIHFVFLSRIHQEKGCKEIIMCAKKMNEEGLKMNYDVTFYGKLDKQYEQEFQTSIDGIENIAYKGLLNLTTQKGYEELSQYDVFLFPTYYYNEGFPGVVIDAYIAGLPIITTDWHFNSQVVKNGVTGLLIEPKNCDALYDAMIGFIHKNFDYEKMQANCLKSVEKYDVNVVLSDTLLQEIGLI